jgi:Ca2+-transporting ATPase
VSITEQSGAAVEPVPPYLRPAPEVVDDLHTDVTSGLSAQEAAQRLATHGPNQITAEKPPSVLARPAVYAAEVAVKPARAVSTAVRP